MNDIGNVPSPDSAVTDKQSENLIHFLDTEIEFIKDERQQPGWTKWAISGSLATLFWLFLNEVENVQQPPLIVIVKCLVVISLASDFVATLNIMLSESSQDHKVKGRFFVTSQIGKGRLTILLLLLRYICILFFVYFSGYTFLGVSIIAYLVNGWSTLGFLAVLVLSFLKFPLPSKVEPGGWIWNISSILTIFAIGYALLIYTFDISNQAQIISSIRIAALISTIYYLILLITRVSTASPLLESLVNIRRELTLGHLEYQVAVEQTDIVVAGLKVSNVLQDYVSKIVGLFDEFNTRIQRASVYMGAIEKIILEVQDELSDEQLATIESLNSSMHAVLLEANDLTKVKIPAALKPLKWRVRIISRLSDSSYDELDNVLDTVLAAIDNSGAQMASLFERSNKLVENKSA